MKSLFTSLQPAFSSWRLKLASLAVVGTTALADGLPDTWERAYGLATNDLADAALDLDEDGLTNLAEYRAGTDPTNSASVLRWDSIELFHETAQLRFQAASNRTYTVLGTSWLGSSSWLRLTDVVAHATNRPVEILEAFHPTNAPRYFQLFTPRAP